MTFQLFGLVKASALQQAREDLEELGSGLVLRNTQIAELQATILALQAENADLTNKNAELAGKLENRAELGELYAAARKRETAPWSMFEVDGIEGTLVKVQFDWNDQFLTLINDMGYSKETPTDSVEAFFRASVMQPEDVDDSDEVRGPGYREYHEEMNESRRIATER